MTKDEMARRIITILEERGIITILEERGIIPRLPGEPEQDTDKQES